MCGEQGIRFQISPEFIGSSPRVRGAVAQKVDHICDRGIIPAHAGSSTPSSSRCTSTWDHPRVCGEQCSPFFARYVRPGSSPRMRGAADAQLVVDELVGIIPACAGSSSRSRPRGTGSWDHPRACGEQALRFFTTLISSGSSPRVRGAAALMRPPFFSGGIIPAHAGNRSNPRLRATSRRDHPRACGEQPRNALRASPLMGSSPRMRETVERLLALRLVAGIIPAHAGSSSAGGALFCIMLGSSPRVRGAVGCKIYPEFCGGIIPARAGSSPRLRKRQSFHWDHPRACGEQHQSQGCSPFSLGSSPRVRGAARARNSDGVMSRDHPRACEEQ